MLDQEAAFVQIQEAKTMVEEDLQRRLEEFEEEKEQLQNVAASAVALEQQLEQARPCRSPIEMPGPHMVASCGCPCCVHWCWSTYQINFSVIPPDLAAVADPAKRLLLPVSLYARPLHTRCCLQCVHAGYLQHEQGSSINSGVGCHTESGPFSR